MNSIDKLFGSNPDLEKSGVEINYGDIWFNVARTGGANKKYSDRLSHLLKPYNHQIKTDKMDNDVAINLVKQAFAETCILGWGSKKHGNGTIETNLTGVLVFSKENIRKLFDEYNDLYTDLKSQADNNGLFQDVEVADEIKNFANSSTTEIKSEVVEVPLTESQRSVESN